MRLSILALALALLTTAPVRAEPPPAAPDPAPKPPPVTVQLEVTQPLSLVEWVAPGQKTGSVSLDGEVRVRIANPGTTPVPIQWLEVHGLVFVDAASGREHVVVHPCQCVKDATGPLEATRVVPPGGEQVLTLDEWGCSSAWTPPPPGRYAVRYRVSSPQGAARRPEDRSRPPNELVQACRARLAAPETWAAAAISAPVEVTLRKPKRQRISE